MNFLLHKKLPQKITFPGSFSSILFLQQMNVVSLCLCAHTVRPDRRLHLSDMCFPQEEHTDTGLTDTAADCIRKLSLQNCFLEWQLRAFLTSRLYQLLRESSSTRIPMEESSSPISRTG